MVGDQRLAVARRVAHYLGSELAARRATLIALFGESALKTARREGLVVPILPAIYASSESQSTLRVRARALTLWAEPHGRVTGLAAAVLWGVTSDAPARVTIHVPAAWHLKGPAWVRLLRADPPVSRFRTTGISLVSAADAVVQVWREAPPDVGVATVIAAITGGQTTASDLLQAVSRRKQLPRRTQLAELIDVAGRDVTSYLEYIARRDVFPPSMFPRLEWQVEVWVNGRKRVLDACDHEAMIDIEFDGRGSHGGAEAFERDRQRDNEVRALGYEPLRYSYRQLVNRAAWCRQNYLEVRARRLRQLGRA